MPSRATRYAAPRGPILADLYSHNHEVKGNVPPDGGFEKFVSEGHEEEKTIVARLQGEGYQTALLGKYLNGYGKEDPAYVPPGWDEWRVKLDKQRAYKYRINENGEVVSYGRGSENFYTDVLSGQVTEYVRGAASDPEGRPFFLHPTPTAPHMPTTPAKRHEGAFAGEEAHRPPSFDEEDVSDKPSFVRGAGRVSEEEAAETDARYRKRLESMLTVDEMIAALVEELEAAGELENTYVFFTSDNGFLQGEHRVAQGKSRPYEESVRVPFFVRGPGITAGSKVEEMVLNTDLVPTLARLAGVEFPADGRSLAPLLHGAEPPSWREAMLLEAEGLGEEGVGPARLRGREDGDAQVRRVRERGEGALRPPKRPPRAGEPARGRRPSLLADLQAKLDALRSCAGDGCREAEDAQ